jgi:dTDP-4-amino-4,6-dideoxygalactose transaminase
VIPFLQLTPGEDAPALRAAIDPRRHSACWFVLGPELEAFEPEFAAATRAPHAVGVGTGTDALAIALRALGIGPGDEVITSPLSAAYTALAIMMAGARPVFADIEADRLTLDPSAAAAAVTARTAAIMPVHPYGQPADMAAIAGVAERHNLAIVEDCCQSHLATCGGRPVGSFGAAAAFASTRRRTSARSATAGPGRRARPRWPTARDACATAARRTGITTASSG